MGVVWSDIFRFIASNEAASIDVCSRSEAIEASFIKPLTALLED
jgi:hypothetical protein